MAGDGGPRASTLTTHELHEDVTPATKRSGLLKRHALYLLGRSSIRGPAAAAVFDDVGGDAAAAVSANGAGPALWSLDCIFHRVALVPPIYLHIQYTTTRVIHEANGWRQKSADSWSLAGADAGQRRLRVVAVRRLVVSHRHLWPSTGLSAASTNNPTP